jgi:hypothetical protein
VALLREPCILAAHEAEPLGMHCSLKAMQQEGKGGGGPKARSQHTPLELV